MKNIVKRLTQFHCLKRKYFNNTNKCNLFSYLNYILPYVLAKMKQRIALRIIRRYEILPISSLLKKANDIDFKIM